MMTKIDIFKIALTLLFVGCLFDMPYAYFQLVRFLGMIGFGFFAYNEYQKKQTWFITWLASAILINPISKISLGREVWHIIDLIWIIILIASVCIGKRTILEFRNNTDSTKCLNCQAFNREGHDFCPKCGQKIFKEQKLTTSPSPSYSYGIKMTLTWSLILSVITVMVFVFLGNMPGNSFIKLGQVILCFALYSMVTLLLAFPYSFIAKSKEVKINRFNAACKNIMALITTLVFIAGFFLSYS